MKQYQLSFLLISTLALTLLFLSCEKPKNEWIFRGSIQNPEIKNVYLYSIDLSRNKTLIDSASVIDNKFIFTSTNKDAGLHTYYFDYDKSQKGGAFIVTQNNDELFMDIKEQYKSKFSKSIFSDDLNDYFNIKQSEINLIIGVSKLYKPNQSKKVMQAAILEYRKKVGELKTKKINFLKKIQSTELQSYLILEEIISESIIDKEVFKEYASILNREAKQTRFGKEIMNIINHFDAYSLNKNAGFANFNEVSQKFDALSESNKKSSYGIEIKEKMKKLEELGFGKTPPSLLAKTLDGEDFNLEQVSSKIILIDFWASWCGPCRLENPHYKKLYDQYNDKGLSIIGYSLDTDKEKWKKAIEKDKISWLNISNLKKQNEDEITKKYQVYGIPANIIIKDGKIAARNLFGSELDNFIYNNL